MLCPTCGLLQLDTTTPRPALYHAGYGFRSGINEAVRTDLKSVVNYAMEISPDAKYWLDIACNDGTLLSFVPADIERYGIDPLLEFEAFADPARAVTRNLRSDYFKPDYYGVGQFDVITSVSMFYDLDDPGEFVRGVADVLAKDGIWVVQMNYTVDMVKSYAVDNVGHEHVTYFGVRPFQELLRANDMDVVDVTYSTVNGGCFRALCVHRGTMPAQQSVYEAIAKEFRMGLEYPHTWQRWFREVKAELQKTYDCLDNIHGWGERCYLYGASTRIGTVLQLMDPEGGVYPSHAVERNPDKVGKMMSSTGIPIISEEEMRKNPPEWLLIGPWFFRDVFVDRESEYLSAGGKMIFPLPRFEVVGG